MSRDAVPRTADGLAWVGAAAAGFAVLAVLVVAGSVSRIDQYAVDHWMPDFEPSNPSAQSIAHQFDPHLGDGPLQVFCNLWTYPASAFISGMVLVLCCGALVRRGQRTAALVWGAVWIAATAAEVVGKELLHRPALHAMEAGVRVSFDNFGHSFPSGHALRGVLTAILLATVWRRTALPALVWAAVTLVALVVSAAHTPSDVLGGLLLALVAAFAVRSFVDGRAAAA